MSRRVMAPEFAFVSSPGVPLERLFPSPRRCVTAVMRTEFLAIRKPETVIRPPKRTRRAQTHEPRPCQCCGTLTRFTNSRGRHCASCVALIPKVLRDCAGRRPSYNPVRALNFSRIARRTAEATCR